MFSRKNRNFTEMSLTLKFLVNIKIKHLSFKKSSLTRTNSFLNTRVLQVYRTVYLLKIQGHILVK